MRPFLAVACFALLAAAVEVHGKHPPVPKSPKTSSTGKSGKGSTAESLPDTGDSSGDTTIPPNPVDPTLTPRPNGNAQPTTQGPGPNTGTNGQTTVSTDAPPDVVPEQPVGKSGKSGKGSTTGGDDAVPPDVVPPKPGVSSQVTSTAEPPQSPGDPKEQGMVSTVSTTTPEGSTSTDQPFGSTPPKEDFMVTEAAQTKSASGAVVIGCVAAVMLIAALAVMVVHRRSRQRGTELESSVPIDDLRALTLDDPLDVNQIQWDALGGGGGGGFDVESTPEMHSAPNTFQQLENMPRTVNDMVKRFEQCA